MPQLDRLTLASASPRRRELLTSLGLVVDVVPSGYAEPDHPELSPLGLAQRHAREKASDVRPRTHGVVVAADTVVDCDGQALNKPRDAAEAHHMLRTLSGRTHAVHTAYALSLPGRDTIEESSSTAVTFYELSDDEIAAYVASGDPMDKAGAYGIQGRAAAMVERIDGDFYTVMGFPLARFVRTLRRLGFSLPATKQMPDS